MNEIMNELKAWKEQASQFIYGLDAYFDEQDDFRELMMVYDIDESGYPMSKSKEELEEIIRNLLAEKYTESASSWIMLAAKSYTEIKNTLLDGIEAELYKMLQLCPDHIRQQLVDCYNDLPELEYFDQYMIETISLPDAQAFGTDRYLEYCQIDETTDGKFLYIDDALDEIVDEMIHYVTDIELTLDDNFAELSLMIIEKFYEAAVKLISQ